MKRRKDGIDWGNKKNMREAGRQIRKHTVRILNHLFYEANLLTHFPSRAGVSVCVCAWTKSVCVCVYVVGSFIPDSNWHQPHLSLRTNATQHSINTQWEVQSLTRCDFNAKHTCVNLHYKPRLHWRPRSQVQDPNCFPDGNANIWSQECWIQVTFLPSFFCAELWRLHGEILLIHALALKMCAHETHISTDPPPPPKKQKDETQYAHTA